jgi:hypothetical protein
MHGWKYHDEPLCTGDALLKKIEQAMILTAFILLKPQ